MNSWDNVVNHLEDKQYRNNFVAEQINIGVPFQVAELRISRGWSQDELAQRAGMKQSRISQVENPDYGSLSISTLKRLAAAFDVALVVRFVPFSELISYVTATPYIVRGLSSESFSIPTFEQEMESIEAKQAALSERTIQAKGTNTLVGQSPASASAVRPFDGSSINRYAGPTRQEIKESLILSRPESAILRYGT